MSDIISCEGQCDENSTISCECSTTRESSSAAAVVEQSTSHDAAPLQTVSSASAPPLPINESIVDTTLDDTRAETSASQISQHTVVYAGEDVSVVIQSPDIDNEIAALVSEEPQILEEVKVIDQFLEELPEELKDLSLDEILRKSTTPLPEVQKVASKLTTSYDQYKAYLNYIQNGSEEKNKIGEPITTIRKKVPGVNCGEEPRIIHQVPVQVHQVPKPCPKPTFYQFLQPAFCPQPQQCCPSTMYSYPSSLFKTNCLQPSYQGINLNQNYNFPSFSAYRGVNKAGLSGNANLSQGFAKGFSKPNYMGGFYGF